MTRNLWWPGLARSDNGHRHAESQDSTARALVYVVGATQPPASLHATRYDAARLAKAHTETRWASQLSGDVLKAMERRSAISGLMPALPLRIALKVLRLVTSACAASVTEMPSGSTEERRVGKEFVRTCRSRWAPYQ